MNQEFSLWFVILMYPEMPSHITPPHHLWYLKSVVRVLRWHWAISLLIVYSNFLFLFYYRYYLTFPVVTITIYPVWSPQTDALKRDWKGTCNGDMKQRPWLFFPSSHLVIFLISIAFVETWTKRPEICIPFNPAYSPGLSGENMYFGPVATCCVKEPRKV